MLQKVTCTGIDQKTDLQALKDLHQEFPFVEFGFLALVNHAEKGFRYPNPAMLEKYHGAGLPLSLHLCGALARHVAAGDWDSTTSVMAGHLPLFERVQLNGIAPRLLKNPWTLTAPQHVRQIIVQARSGEDPTRCGEDLTRCALELYAKADANPGPAIAVLLDASGGRGLEGTPLPTQPLNYVGYAGGLGPDNVVKAACAMAESPNVNDFWLDMETRIRTGQDQFSIDLCRQVCRALQEASEGGAFQFL